MELFNSSTILAPDPKQKKRLLSPHLGDVQEAVNALEVDEKAVVSHGRDGPLAELLRVGAGEVGHVLDHLGRGGLGGLSLAVGQEAHVDAPELLVHLQ